jgi:hypothetical protein
MFIQKKTELFQQFASQYFKNKNYLKEHLVKTAILYPCINKVSIHFYVF